MISSPVKGGSLGALLAESGGKYKRTSSEKVTKELAQFNSAVDAQARERQREFENLRIYCGIDNSAWPNEIQNFMSSEGRGNVWESFRHLGNYNIARVKIDGIAGSIVRNPFDISYVADEEEQVDLTLALQQAYYSDKELLDYNQEYLYGVILGVGVYQSVMRIMVRTEHPAEPTGRIGLTCMPPGSTVIDPSWKSNTSKDLNNLWVLAYYTVDQLKTKYNLKKDLIEQEEWLIENMGESYEADTLTWNKDIPQKVGDRYLTVEHHYLKKEKIVREFDPQTSTTFWEWMSDEDKRKLVEQNSVNLDDIEKIELWDNVHSYCAFCPGLITQELLHEGKAEFQLGRLPFFPLSAARINGKPMPFMDQLRDAALEMNKRIATISNVAERQVTSGLSIDEYIVGMNEEKKKEVENNINNPEYILWQKAGSSRQFPNAIRPLIENKAIPGDLFGIANMMIDLMDRLVPQPAANEGRSEKSGESGILYAQKVEIAKTMQTVVMAVVRQFWNDIGESYFFLAKQLYRKGRRVFTNALGTKKTIINEPDYTEQGEETILNDFSALSRHRVIISEAPAGVNNRLVQRELNAMLTSNYAAVSPNAAITFAENMIRSIDMDQVQKEKALEGIELDRKKIVSATNLQIAQAEAGLKQLQQAIQAQEQQAQAGQQGMPPAGGPGGAPAPGGPPMLGGAGPEVPPPMPAEAAPLPPALEGGPMEMEPGIGNPPSSYNMAGANG